MLRSVCLLNMVIFYCHVALLVLQEGTVFKFVEFTCFRVFKLVDTGYKIMEDLRILVIL